MERRFRCVGRLVEDSTFATQERMSVMRSANPISRRSRICPPGARQTLRRSANRPSRGTPTRPGPSSRRADVLRYLHDRFAAGEGDGCLRRSSKTDRPASRRPWPAAACLSGAIRSWPPICPPKPDLPPGLRGPLHQPHLDRGEPSDKDAPHDVNRCCRSSLEAQHPG